MKRNLQKDKTDKEDFLNGKKIASTKYSTTGMFMVEVYGKKAIKERKRLWNVYGRSLW